MRSRCLLALLACAAFVPQARAQVSQPLSDRVVAYTIDAKYDAKNHSLDGVETLTYTNHTGQPLDHFPFHLYLNAFQPKATWVRDAHRDGSRDFGPGSGWDSKHSGSNEIKSLTVEGMGDLTKQIKFISPDDGNPDDKTVFDLALPKPVPPNGKVTFHINFHAQFPEVVARSGYKRDFLLAGQWFPKVGVFWNGKWNCHQYHGNTEFFADFGTFDVNVSIPSNYNFGSTGVVTATRKNPDGTTTYTTHAEDVHDFAWTADPTTVVINDSINLQRGKTDIRVLMQPGHMSSAQRYIDALKTTMTKFEEWYGPYPYPQITVVDPPHGAGAAGGMEYPMFFTGDTSWFMPKSILLPEIVVEHEYGHQYWYGMVATNEFEDAWLDEGINSYSEVKTMDVIAHGSDRSVFNGHLATLGESELQRLEYALAPDLDPLTRNAWEFLNGESYSGVSYGKTSTVLLTLESIIGPDKVREALHTYFMRYRFKHPREEDFMNTVNEVAGQNLDWYWDQAVRGTQKLDYRILSAKSDRDDWYAKDPDAAKSPEYTTAVVVHRKGDFVMPVDVLVKFNDNSQALEHWDGRDRWHRFEFHGQRKLESAELYPGKYIPLDLHRFNDSYVEHSDTRATSKLALYWMWATQMMAHLISWLV